MTAAVNYKQYIQSEEWKERRKQAIIRADFRCQLCGWKPTFRNGQGFNVHHNNYDRLGNELPTDLCVLCIPCHKRFHGVRKGASGKIGLRTGKKRHQKKGSIKLGVACDECGGELLVIAGKHNRFIGCTGFPRCKGGARQITATTWEELRIPNPLEKGSPVESRRTCESV